VNVYTTHITLLGRLGQAQPNPAAWDEFCDRYGDLIRSFARRQGLQPSDCDDVLQDVLLALSSAMQRFEYDPARGKFRSFLKTLTLRAVFRRFRQNHRAPGQGTEEALASAPSPDDAETEQRWEDEWRQHHLRQAMRSIDAEFSDADRAAFRLYALGSRPAQDTAAALGISVDRVYQAKSRILARLSALIAEQVEAEG
jgi:RNA polymerase sigma-70 factor (ECF subfamily)